MSVCAWMWKTTHVDVYVCGYACKCASVYINMYVWMGVYVCTGVRVCLCAYVSMYMYVNVYKCAGESVRVHM